MKVNYLITNKYLSWSALIAVASVLRWINLGKRSIWLDEAYSLKLASFSLSEIITGAKMDIHPPLFHILLSWWSSWLGQSELALRSFSAILGVLLIPIAYHLGKLLGTSRLGWTTAWLVACSPYFIELSRLGRMPALLACLMAASIFYFWKIIHEHKLIDFIIFTIVLSAALYTHYFSILLLIAFHLYIFIGIGKLNLSRGIRKKWFLLQLVLLAVYAPWLPTLWQQLSKGGPAWRGIGSAWYEPVHVIYNLVLGTACWKWWQKGLAIGLLGLAISLVIIRLKPVLNSIYQQLAPRVWGWLITSILVIIGLVWIYSTKKLNVFDHRYLSAVALMLIILMSAGLVALSRQWQIKIMLVIVMAFSVPVFNQLFNLEYYDDWRSLTRTIMQQQGPNTVVAVYPAWNENPLNYYLKDSHHLIGLPGHYHPITGVTRPFFHITEQNLEQVEERLHGHQDVILLLVNEGKEQQLLLRWFKDNYMIRHKKRLGGLYLWHGKK